MLITTGDISKTRTSNTAERAGKKSVLTILIGCLLVSMLGTAFLFWRDMRVLNNAYADMNNVEYISSSTQRLISLVQSKQYTQKDIFNISDSTVKALVLGQANSMSVLENPEMVVLANEVLHSWTQIETLLQSTIDEEGNEVAVDIDAILIDLGLARDSHFRSMTDLANQINVYASEINSVVAVYQIIIIAIFLAITLIMILNLLQTHAELKISQELAETAQIDISTGLYNRSRCQELFKMSSSGSTKKHPAIIVLDLNDLKKTNDNLGHRIGDELIQSFANALKGACHVHVTPPFIGRYGGDEFIIFYEDIENEDEIKIYLKELKFFADECNNNETRFQISFAVGYALVSADDDEKLTTRQLFDKADAAMYENKIAGKRALNPNYDEEKAKGEVR